MLRPTKHMHPDRTVISVASLLLDYLRKNRVGQFDDLRHYIKKVLSHVQNTDAIFLPAINLLYILGLIDYRPKTDSFEFIGKTNLKPPTKRVSKNIKRVRKNSKQAMLIQ